MSMALTKEVLPPRQAPICPRDAIVRSIWTSAALVGFSHVAARLLGTW